VNEVSDIASTRHANDRSGGGVLLKWNSHMGVGSSARTG
jgi:hypothetical protein